MTEWLKTPDLSVYERDIVRHLHAAAQQGSAQWEAARQTVSMNFFHFLLSAILKARAAGLLRKWNTA